MDINYGDGIYNTVRHRSFSICTIHLTSGAKACCRFMCAFGLNVRYSFLIQTTDLLKYLYLNQNQCIVNYLAISVRANMHTHYRKKN